VVKDIRCQYHQSTAVAAVLSVDAIFNRQAGSSQFSQLKAPLTSSETTYAVCFADGELQPEYIPIDEEHPTIPHDSYAMSKVCNEACGRSFHARFGADIYGLRINNVIEPHEYALNFPRPSGCWQQCGLPADHFPVAVLHYPDLRITRIKVFIIATCNDVHTNQTVDHDGITKATIVLL